MCRWAHREHEEGVEHESHGGEGLDGGHHVPLQTQREDDEQRHGDQQQHAEDARHLERKRQHSIEPSDICNSVLGRAK